MKKRTKLFLQGGVALIFWSGYGQIAPGVSQPLPTKPVTVDQLAQANLPLRELDYQHRNATSNRLVGTQMAKVTIRSLLHQRKTVINAIQPIVGKKAAGTLNTHYKKIDQQLTPLLNWTDVPAQALYDGIFRSLVQSGVPYATANDVANAISMAL